MKRIALFVALSFLGAVICFSQDIKVVYESYPKYSDEIIESLPGIALDKNKYRYTLTIKSYRSIFQRDSLIISKPYNHNRVEIWQFEQVYKDYRADEWLRTSEAYYEGTGYLRKISELTANNNFGWTVTGRQKMILGFNCKEVIDGTKIAWYTQEIPIPDGPNYGIFGLPGLVLEYEDKSGHWMAVDMNVNTKGIGKPDVKTTDNELDIKMSVFDLKDLPPSKAIRVDNSTPVNKWIGFDGK